MTDQVAEAPSKTGKENTNTLCRAKGFETASKKPNSNQAQASGQVSTDCQREARSLTIKSELSADSAHALNKKRVQTQRTPLAELSQPQTAQ